MGKGHPHAYNNHQGHRYTEGGNSDLRLATEMSQAYNLLNYLEEATGDKRLAEAKKLVGKVIDDNTKKFR